MRKPPVRAPRFGNYRITRLAATPLEQPGTCPPSSPAPAAWRTLWASRPLELPDGRAVGVRRRGEELEVAFVSKLTLSLRWEPAEKVLTSRQAQAWRDRSEFAPR